MTTAQRRATKQYRDRRSKERLKRLEVQVPAAEVEVIRKAARILRAGSEAAVHLRAHLGLSRDRSPGRSALDVFAMEEPLSAAGEALWEQAMQQVVQERKDSRLNRPRDTDL